MHDVVSLNSPDGGTCWEVAVWEVDDLLAIKGHRPLTYHIIKT